MSKIYKIFLNAVPVLAMVVLIPVIQDDYWLALVYIGIIGVSFRMKRERGELKIFVFGFFAMIFFEYIFVSTGVETFYRNSLFGLMPLWLPLLWAYGFVGISRGVKILNN